MIGPGRPFDQSPERLKDGIAAGGPRTTPAEQLSSDVRLDDSTCLSLLGAAEHGILCTLHPIRGVDPVPVCFALTSGLMVTPVDAVKPKRTARLERVKNLDRDPRAALLCEQWDGADWAKLWWVRASLQRLDADGQRAAARKSAEDELRQKYPHYRAARFDEILWFAITNVSGWSATARNRRSSGPSE
jgi:hypothetical protein